MHTVHGSRRGVLYVYDGKMMGGNSAFAFIGTYQDADGDVSVDISTLRHNEDPKFQPLLKTDKITLTLRGKQRGEQYFFEGATPQFFCRKRRDRERALFHSHPDARRHRRRQYRCHGAARWPDPRWRCLL
jgi:hypothetical protein